MAQKQSSRRIPPEPPAPPERPSLADQPSRFMQLEREVEQEYRPQSSQLAALGIFRWTFSRPWVKVVWNGRYRLQGAVPTNRGTGTGKRGSARAFEGSR